MKTWYLKVIIPVVFFTSSAVAQSDSYRALENTFSQCHDVHSFRVSGFLARTVLWISGEHEFKNAIREVKSIRLMTIPTSEFKVRGVSFSRYKKLLERDLYEPLIHVRDHGDDVTFYIQSTQKHNNRYMVLVEEPDGMVMVIELKGFIDTNLLLKDSGLAYQK